MKAKKESKKVTEWECKKKKQPRVYTVSEHRKAIKRIREKYDAAFMELQDALIAERTAARETEKQLYTLKDNIERETLPEIVALNKALADAETDRDNFKAGFENYRMLYHQAIEKSITRRIINWWTRRKDG